MMKFMSQCETDISKRQSSFKLELNETVESMRQVTRALQEDSITRNKNIAVLSGEIAQRKRGEENIYSEIDDLRKKVEEGLCKMVNQREFIDFKS